MDSILYSNNLIGKWTVAIGLPIVMVVGIVGNSLSFLIYSRKFFAKTSCSYYLRAISVTDTVYLVILVFSFMSRGLGINVRNNSEVGCKLIWFTYYVAPTTSAWIEAIVCFDRMVNITKPRGLGVFTKRGCTFVMIVAVILIQTGIYSPLLYFYQLVPSTSSLTNSSITSPNGSIPSGEIVSVSYTCMMTDDSFAAALSWYDLIYSNVVPFLVMLLSTIAILAKIYQTRKNVSGKLNSTNQQSSAKKKREQKDFQFAVTSVSLCLLYFVLNIGILLFDLLSTYDLVAYEYYQLGFAIVLVIAVMHNSLKFYVYLLVNNNFRAQFYTLIKTNFGSAVPFSSSVHSNNDNVRPVSSDNRKQGFRKAPISNTA